MTKKTPEATRAKLLQAAITIVVEHGAAHLTLNAVAQTAQVSKGGLLHHFPSKEALLYGIDDVATQMWSERLQYALAQEPEDQPGRWSRAYIRACFDRQPEENHVLLAVTRIVGVYPSLIERWRAMYQQAGAHVSDDGLPMGRALSIQVACDGLWLSEMMGLPLLPETKRAAVRADLLKLTYAIQ
jgi:AcrR family transcriptional regulator